MNLDFLRTRVTTPHTTYSPIRFAFLDSGDGSGTAAIWEELKHPNARADRLALVTGSVTRSSGRDFTFTTDDNEVWTITRLAGGCCGAAARSLLASFTLAQLTSPDLTSVPA